MKTSLFQFVCTTGIVLFVTAFTFFSFSDFALTVKVKGMENKDLLKEGLSPTELAPMTLESNDEQISIEKFEVILARGTRPVAVHSIQGNEYDLANFTEQARAGDRIVIEVQEVSSADVLDENAYISIPIR